MGSIKIRNLHFSYNKEIFKNLNFTLKEGKSLSIIGSSATGKTTLLKILNSELEYDGTIYINDILVNEDNYHLLKKEISIIFKDTSFLYDKVIDELKNELIEELNSDDINKKLEELNTFFNVKKLYEKRITDLNKQDQLLIKILSYAIAKPKYLVLDDIMYELDMRTKILLYNYLNKQNITIINVTTNLEEVLFTDYVLCLYNGLIAIDGPTLKVLEQEKILKRLGFELPFYFDLSIQLKLYGLINRICLNKEELVKELWK